MDTRDDEKERGITIKSTAISMYMHMDKEDIANMKQKNDGPLCSSLAGHRLTHARDRRGLFDQPYRLARSRRLFVRGHRRSSCH